MADSISVKFDVSGALKELRRIERATDRATMYAIRAGGRRVKTVAKRAAPRYAGKPRMVDVNGRKQPIKRGELRAAIGSSKRLKGGHGSYSLKVGPRGEHVRLYAPKQEERAPFMAPAASQVTGEMPAIAEKAWNRAINRR
jgi:hypothetical protein